MWPGGGTSARGSFTQRGQKLGIWLRRAAGLQSTRALVGRVDPFRTLIDFPGFQDGFWLAALVGTGVLALGGIYRLLRRGTSRRSVMPLGFTGPAWVLVSLAILGGWNGYQRTDTLPSGLLWGLAILMVGGEIADRTPNPKIIGFVCAAPGAYLVGTAQAFPGPDWSKWVVIGTVAVGAPLAADLDRRSARLGLGPILWLIAVAGVYWTVPDTERMRPLIGAALPLAFTSWPKRWSRMGAGGVGAAVGLLLWVASIEGRGRNGSIVGAGACLGLFVAEPIGRVLTKGRIATLSRSMKVGTYECCLLAAQLVVVGYASRVVGLAQSGGTAVALLIPAVPVSVAVGGLIRASERLRPRSRRSISRRPRSASARQ